MDSSPFTISALESVEVRDTLASPVIFTRPVLLSLSWSNSWSAELAVLAVTVPPEMVTPLFQETMPRLSLVVEVTFTVPSLMSTSAKAVSCPLVKATMP